MQSVGSLLVLAAVIRGSERSAIKPYLQDIVSILTEPTLCRVADVSRSMEFTLTDYIFLNHIGVNRPAIVREILHFGLFPAFFPECPAFLA